MFTISSGPPATTVPRLHLREGVQPEHRGGYYEKGTQPTLQQRQEVAESHGAKELCESVRLGGVSGTAQHPRSPPPLKAYAEGGHLAMILGGIWFASRRDQSGKVNSGEPWLDQESRPYIDEGAARARLEQRNDGRPRYVRGVGIVTPSYIVPMTSTDGCPTNP